MMKVQVNCSSKMTPEEMQATREMGVEYLAVNFLSDDADYEGIMRFQEQAEKYELKIADAGCPPLQKCPSIHLGKSDRDIWIDKYNEFTRALGKAGVPINYIAWQPNGIFRTKIGPGKYNRGANSFICDMNEIMARPLANDRVYGEQEIWDNFKYFLDRALPVCEEANVKLALHPNDPPVESLCGVHSLIWNTECYKRAFEMAGNSPYLGMKMCIGCWLESESFGNLMEDIKTFTESGHLLIVHFRNVSSTMPYFEETLIEDGYADMFAIMKQLVSCGFNGALNIDHPFFMADQIDVSAQSAGYFNQPLFGAAGKVVSAQSAAYFTGYMKALLHCAEKTREATVF